MRRSDSNRPGKRALAFALSSAAAAGISGQSGAQTASGVTATHPRHKCPAEMVQVHRFCVDRWEMTTVDRNSNQPLSPYYPPLPGYLNRVLDVWQVERFEWGRQAARSFPLPEVPLIEQSRKFEPVAASCAGRIPQAYLSREVARRACANAGKRLCSYEEWQTACRGEKGTKFPYGNDYVAGRCNVYRAVHPARELHGSFSMGHLDPRLNLVDEATGVPLLLPTGSSAQCVSHWGSDVIYDMVGNLDEWIADDPGMFVGGFYSRNTTNGCDAKVTNHAATYFDYSTGARCCRDTL